MKTILIATANRGKAEEIRKIFEGTEYDLKFLFDFPDETKYLNLVENAKSFEGNALIKAIIAGDVLNMLTLADDSGLVIKALDGRPGVYSARYSGEGDDKANYLKVLDEMKDIPFASRDCYYHCSVAIYDPKTKFVDTVSGTWEGKVAFEPKGDKSFGYAPIILAKDFNYERTNAEFDHTELINVNHRGKAFRKAIDVLRNYLK
jgi:XTP/dITP diphosphohydrolase